MTQTIVNRRQLISGTAALGGIALIGSPALAARGVERRLAFRNVHTNERVDARYYGPRGLDMKGLAEINHGLRDWRTGKSHQMDFALLNLLGRPARPARCRPAARVRRNLRLSLRLDQQGAPGARGRP
jgi:uncharacterized protein YcbK (DUF882 family)